MKKIYKSLLTIALSVGFTSTILAQTGNFAANYIFSSLPGSYTALTTPTVLTSGAGMDEVVSIVSLSSPLSVNGNTYTSVFVSENGWVSFGGTNPGTNYSMLSSGTSSFVIAAFSRDNGGIDATSEMSWSEAGTDVVFQWKNIQRFSSSAGEILNFQIKINKTTGLINVVYGNCVLASGSSVTYPQVGIRSGATTWASDVNNLTIANTTGNCSWANAVAGSANTSTMYFNFANPAIAPTNGLTFSWKPATLAPPVRTIAAATGVGTNSVVINFTQPAGLPVAYKIQTRPLNTCAWLNAGIFAAAPSLTLTGLNSSTVYEYRIKSYVSLADSSIYSHIPATFSTSAVVCSGTPNAGNATASNTVLCSAQNVNFNLTGSTAAVGLNYLWFSSPDGITWTPIPTATNIATTQSVIASTYYQCVVACGTSTAASSPIQVNIAPTTTNTVPYFEGFEGITLSNQLPNCSWAASNLITICQTNTISGTNNRIPKTGSKFADFRYGTAVTGDYFYTNGIQLTAGTNYIASADYVTDGAAGWSEFSLLVGSSQSTVGLSNIASATGALVNTVYANLNGTFSVSATGIYYIAIKGVGNSTPWYLSFDDVKVFAAPTCTAAPVAGVISGPVNVNTGSINSYSISPAVGNIQWYSSPSLTGPWNPIGSATLATNQTITAVGSGTVFYAAIASTVGCPNDTTNIPLVVNVIFQGDNVCNAIPLTIGTSPSYNVFGATTQIGEVAPVNTGCSTNNGWCNSTINNTIWFTFVAPASGNVSIQSPGFDSQLAIWSATNCANLIGQATPTAPIGATLVAANDDDANYVANGGANFSSYVRAACLTPGTTYYIQLDSYNAAAGSLTTTIVITDLGTLNTSFTGLASSYCVGAGSSSLTPATAGGLFTVNNGTVTVTSYSPAAIGTETVTYSIFGCVSNSVTTVVTSATVIAISSSTLLCSGQSATLTANGASSYTWMPAGTGSAIVVSPTTTATYTVTGENACGTSSATVIQNVSICTGVSEALLVNNVSLYPNPNFGSVTIELASELIENTSIIVIDALGKVVISEKIITEMTTINTANLNNGVYFYKIICNNKDVKIGKIVKQ